MNFYRARTERRGHEGPVRDNAGERNTVSYGLEP